MSQKLNPFDQMVADCTAARKKYEQSEVDYFEFLTTIEKGYEQLWRPACGTFAHFLEVHVGRPRPTRYTEFQSAVSRLGIGFVRGNGIDAAIEAARVSPARQSDYVQATADWVRTHDGVHPSRETASDLRKMVDPAPRTPRSTEHARETEALRKDNAALKRRCDELTAENKRLTADNERLRADNDQLRALRAPAGEKPRGARASSDADVG